MCMRSHFSHVWLFVTLQTVACQAPLSMGFSRQESWGGLPVPSPGKLPSPGTEPVSLMSPALGNEFFTTSTTREDFCRHLIWNSKTILLWYLIFFYSVYNLLSICHRLAHCIHTNIQMITSVSTSSTFPDLTNHQLKTFEKQIQKILKNKSLNLLYTSKCLFGNSIVFCGISYLKMI